MYKCIGIIHVHNLLDPWLYKKNTLQIDEKKEVLAILSPLPSFAIDAAFPAIMSTIIFLVSLVAAIVIRKCYRVGAALINKN